MMKYDHPILAMILELHVELTRNRKEKTVLVLVPKHGGIRGNFTADFDGDISDEHIPISDLKPNNSDLLCI